jgi:flagellar biosynthesis protein FlhG
VRPRLGFDAGCLKPGNLSNVIELDRARTQERPEEAPRPKSAGPPGMVKRGRARRIIAVGGGKGGIGKTLVSANLAISLAKRGHRVVAVDADLGGANLHTCLGVAQPAATLSDFVNRRTGQLEQLTVPSGVEGLFLIAGAMDALDAANLKYQQKLKLLRNLQSLDVDYVVLDLGAGTTFNVLDFFLIADHGLLVLLPEPTSIENAYRFVKAAFFRRLQNVEERYGIAHFVDGALAAREDALQTPFELVAEVGRQNPPLAAQLARELESFRVRLVVNQARNDADQKVGPAVVAAWRKFFGLSMDYLGAIQYDDAAWRAIRKRRPVVLESPESASARAISTIADGLLALDGKAPKAP